MVRVGLAMLQGARHEHVQALNAAAAQLGCDLEIVELRRGSEVDQRLDCLVLPGGESTAMRKASRSESLLSALFSWMEAHPNRPVLGTCAGAILLANPGEGKRSFLRAEISRNAWGRQRDSFEGNVSLSLETPPGGSVSSQNTPRDQFNHQPLPVESSQNTEDSSVFPGVFIRAPRFVQTSIHCIPVAFLDDEVVGVQDGSYLALTFHPELTNDYRFHRWLLHKCYSSDNS
tara:strand:- start:2511 stop:3203 length:693 start_codon:yes stop_codon:yes gene_type:complete